VAHSDGNRSNLGRDIDGDLAAWITRDQRELPLNGMDNQHLHSAIAALTRWRGHEQDDDKRDDLKQWIARFKGELKKRVKAAERELKQRQGKGAHRPAHGQAGGKPGSGFGQRSGRFGS
jgi:hypothetical protein